ncbi:MAG: TIGR01841 family phasin [Pseudomonadota bacterium]|nr:TIGR01841 family phasin [Pseudomonadota bacterium]
MTTAKKTTTDAFQFPQFDVSKLDVAKLSETYREFAEKAMKQSTEAYETYKNAAEEATASAQKSFDAMREGATVLSAKAIENTKANTEAGVAFVEKLTGAKTFAEVLELQGEFFRSAFETLASQAKETQDLAVKVSEKTVAPAKAAAEKAMAEVPAAAKTAKAA